MWRTPPYPRTDERRIAASADFRHAFAVWVLDLATRALSKRSAAPGGGTWVDWSADGRRILRAEPLRNLKNTQSIVWQSADGGDSAKRILDIPSRGTNVSLAPDQHSLVFGIRGDIMARPLVGDTVLAPIAATSATELFPCFSPDSRWIAYSSDESGRSEVYVKPYPGPGARLQVSDGGGAEPVWSRDGKRLFYRNGQAMVAADLSGNTALSVAKRQQLFTGDFYASEPYQQAAYDVAPDGHHFVIARNVYAGGSELQVWTGWLPELKKRMAAAQ